MHHHVSTAVVQCFRFQYVLSFLVAISLGLIVRLLSSLILTCLCCQICSSLLFFSYSSLKRVVLHVSLDLPSRYLNYSDVGLSRNKRASLSKFEVSERSEG